LLPGVAFVPMMTSSLSFVSRTHKDDRAELQMDEIGRRYLSLALHLNRHFEGFVDAYFGPAELRSTVETGEPRSLQALAHDAGELQASVEASDYDPRRKEYLLAQTRTMSAVVRKLSGEQLDYVEEVELCFDITPEMVDERVFEAFRSRMDLLLPGKGSLGERTAAWEQSVELRPDLVLAVCERLVQEARSRARVLFDVPPDEEVCLKLVKDQPWQAYNWYLGHGRSRIEVSTDLPVGMGGVVPGMPHETYPGHHTELTVKENLLYEGKGWWEHSIVTAGPQAVISEGLAMWAWEIIFEDSELVDFLREELSPLAGLPAEHVERDIAVMRANESMVGVVDGNAALLLHKDGRPPEEAQQYLVDYGLVTPDRAAKGVEFLLHPLSRAYIFNYGVGRKLLAPLLQGKDRVRNFARLLSEPFTPTQVRQWVAERDAGGSMG
jgi:hypothetical protein